MVVAVTDRTVTRRVNKLLRNKMKESRAVVVAKTASLWKRLLRPLRLDVTRSAAYRETREDEGTGSLLTVMPPQTTVGVRLKLKECG